MDSRSRSSSASYRFGPYSVDVPAGQLRKHGVKIRLAGQPFDVLVMLLQRAGQVVTREEIQSQLWSGETFVDFENSLNKAINKLRQALADPREEPKYIETLPRRGYRFIAPIEALPSESGLADLTPETNQITASAQANLPGEMPVQPGRVEVLHTEEPPHPLRTRNQVWRWTLYALGCVALVASVFFFAYRWQNRSSSVSISSIAVLPLDSLSNEPGQEYFADGVTDELITQLAKTGMFRVTSRTSSMQFKKSSKNVRQIAADLGVEALVEGSIERMGDRVRIRAQLIRASTDQHLWAESYDGSVNDLLALEDRVARDIAVRVAVHLTPQQEQRIARKREVDPEAYLNYLRGRYCWNLRSAQGFERARGYFQAAIDKDPNYAAASAGLADTYLLLGGYELRSQNDMIPKARAAAQRALQIENLAEAHATLGLIAENYDWDWATAEKEFRTAIDLNPNYSTAHHWYGESFLAATGRFDEAFVEMKRASELDPLSPIISTDLGVTFFLARRYDEAIAQLRRTLELYPDYGEAQMWLARSYEQKNMCPEAISVIEKSQASREQFIKNEELGRVYAKCGRQAEAVKILDDLEKAALTQFVDPALSAHVLMGLGRKREALQRLEESLHEHSTALTSLKVNSLYDPLRSEPQFTDLLRTVHLSQ